jgi:hypothetical protein
MRTLRYKSPHNERKLLPVPNESKAVIYIKNPLIKMKGAIFNNNFEKDVKLIPAKVNEH